MIGKNTTKTIAMGYRKKNDQKNKQKFLKIKNMIKYPNSMEGVRRKKNQGNISELEPKGKEIKR